MVAEVWNEDVHIPDEFVCDAIPASLLPAGSAVGIDSTLRSEAGRLAALISGSPNPDGTLALFQKLLKDQLASIQRGTGA
jgi:hypothetical protein